MGFWGWVCDSLIRELAYPELRPERDALSDLSKVRGMGNLRLHSPIPFTKKAKEFDQIKALVELGREGNSGGDITKIDRKFIDQLKGNYALQTRLIEGDVEMV